MIDKIRQFVEEYINPALEVHKGELTVESFDEDTGELFVQLGGSCKGCAASSQTLHLQVKACLIDEFPSITGLVDTTNHADGTNPFYKE
tara:strand:- start:152 stop:418 length:267 start_codon:yes stop_codon:yes gene_type:complete